MNTDTTVDEAVSNENEETQVAEVTEENDGITTKSKKGILIAVVAIVVVAIVGVVLFFTLGNQGTQPADDGVVPVATDETAAVYLTLVAEDSGKDITDPELILPAEAQIYDADKKVVENHLHLTFGKEVKIAELADGDYTLQITAAPVEINGSTYKLPKDIIKFTVATEGEDAKNTVTVKLTRIDVEDMTKEQLEAVAARIEKAGNDVLTTQTEATSLVTDLKKKAETATSDPDSVKDVEGDTATTPETPTNSGGDGSTTPTTPTNPSNPTSPTTPEKVWVETSPAWDEQVQTGGGYYETVYDNVTEYGVKCSNCGYTIWGASGWSALSGHVAETGHSGSANEASRTIQVPREVWIEPTYTTVHHPAEGYWQ